MALFVGVALLAALTAGQQRSALALAAALVAISALLAGRLLLSAHRAGALAREEAAREQRRQAERLEAVSRLAGGIAHEFNNLMARIIGNAELGEASLPAGAEAREHFVRARAAAARAADLTSQLLAFSGQRHTRPTLVDAETAAHESLRRATHDLGVGIGVEFTAGPGPSAVLADPEQLRGAVEQLIENAIEAMPQGGRLVIGLSREVLDTALESSVLSVPPGKYVVLTVADTGMGMNPDVVRIACEPFYSTKPAHLGAGLGLAVVHGFVTSHGGGLTIDSTPGAGTTVRLYLPAV
ncbi:MAG: ATP-binding protein [Vicinamibacterales bacterium]